MTHIQIAARTVPPWLLALVKILGDSRRDVDNIDGVLRRVAAQEGTNTRLAEKAQAARDALGAVKVCLSAMDWRAERVLDEIVTDTTRGAHSPSVGGKVGSGAPG